MSDSGNPREAGAEHLQAAARELIAAARSFLDVAEEAVADPEVLHEAGTLLGDLLSRAASAVAPRADGSDGTVAEDACDDPAPSGEAQVGDQPCTSARSRVRRIDVE